MDDHACSHKKMALFRYFKRDSAGTVLPDPKGSLSASLAMDTIKSANKAVLEVSFSKKPSSRGQYQRFSPKEQVSIVQYALLHGNKAATHHFS